MSRIHQRPPSPTPKFPVLPLLPLAAALLAAALLAAAAGARPSPAPPRPAPEPPWEGAPFAADPAAVARAAAAVQGEPGDDVVVLWSEASYAYDEAGRETYSQRLVYKILTAGAHESWSAVEEPWSPWHQDRPAVRARVITPDGAEHDLDPTTVTENAESSESPDMFEDGRVLRAPLPATRPGAVVEQMVTVRDREPFFAAGVVRFHGVDLGVPVRHGRLTLDAPAAMPLRWAMRGLPGVEAREAAAGGRRRVVFEIRDLEPADDPEPGLPPETPRSAYVAFSTGRSWADLARRYSDVVDGALRGADLGAFLRSAVKGAPPASQLDLINAYLARLGEEVRYTGVELGDGGLMPRKPAETLRRRFGDCKDKAVLLTAMLRASDIPAYVALLDAAEDEQDVEESLPGFGMFNHAIVVVPGSPALWIDPTDPYARAGELPVGDQGRLALIASPTATGLTRTPESTSADNREIETREVFLADLGPSRIVETTEYHGALESALRALYAAQDETVLKSAMKQYAASSYLAEDVAALEHSKPNDLSAPLRTRAEFRNARRGFTDARNAAVGVSPASLLSRLPEELSGADDGDGQADEGGDSEPRQNEYVFLRPLQLEVRYRVVPPPGYAPQPLPAARVRRLGTVTLAEDYAAGPGGVVTASFRLDTGRRRITAAEFEAVRKGVREALAEKPALLLFDQVGEAHLAAGRVREALEEFQRLAALSPKRALPRSRIARALLAGGMGEAAREEARRALQLEPKFAAAWRDLGWILQHDEVGRRFGRGFDRAGAVAAYRKARELDPKDEIARADLAILLEHDAQGRRYGPAADLAGAIAEYQALRKDLGNHGMDENLLLALVRAGRFDEAKRLAAELKDSQTGSVLGLVATAATDGAEAAVREAERRFNDEKACAAALQQAGQHLLLVRRYAEAAVLLDRAGRQSANAAALLSMADLLKRAKRHEEIRLEADQPATVAKRFVIALFAGEADPKRLGAYLSRDLQAQIAREDKREDKTDKGGRGSADLLTQGLASLRDSLGDVPVDTALDLGLSAMRESVSGDDAGGYRIAFSSTLGGTARAFEVYVVREEGELRIAALDSLPEMLARQALQRAGRGDLQGARRWLDWAGDEEDGRPATGSAGDPLPADPFAVLWAKGAQPAPGEAEQIRCAAAALLVTAGRADEAPPILEACRAQATDPARRNALDLALALAYQRLGRGVEMEGAARRLAAGAPGSDRAEGLLTASLIVLDRWDEVRVAAEARLARKPDDPLALRLLAQDALHSRDLEGAERRFDRLVESGRGTANDYNQLAWIRLELGRVDDRTVELGQRAATLSSYGQPSYLHTLASIYAEGGKTAEAYRLILQSVDARAGGSPAADDWYVFGRLAEHYGLPDVARGYYRRVPPAAAKGIEEMSTHALAARRLAALGGPGDARDNRVASRRAAKK